MNKNARNGQQVPPSTSIIFFTISGAIVVGIFGHPLPAVTLATIAGAVFCIETVKTTPKSRLRPVLLVLTWSLRAIAATFRKLPGDGNDPS